jgi:hypothetical protein
MILAVTEDDEILTTENDRVMPIEYAEDTVTSSLTEI